MISYAYPPSVGGIETVSAFLADGLSRRGYAIRVVTATAGRGDAQDGPRVNVIRRPGARELVRSLLWADVVVQSNVSLILSWPLWTRIARRPWMVVNHTPIQRGSGRMSWRDNLKLRSLRTPDVYSVSEYLRDQTPVPSDVIANPFDEQVFHPREGGESSYSGALLFVGRLVRAKGLDVLIEALRLLADSGSGARLDVVGDGPDRALLERQAHDAGLSDQIRFFGMLSQREVAKQMQCHDVLVVPSRPEPPEALGLVAVEGIACGAFVIGTDQGGLPEAIGSCGSVVAPGRPAELAAAISRATNARTAVTIDPTHRDHHLERFRRKAVLDAYEAAIGRCLGGCR